MKFIPSLTNSLLILSVLIVLFVGVISLNSEIIVPIFADAVTATIPVGDGPSVFSTGLTLLPPTSPCGPTNPNLYISSEDTSSTFSGATINKVVICDFDIADTTQAKGEPDVTVNGRILRMVQATDGNWYGYFAEKTQAQQADSMVVTPGTGSDFGVFCDQDTASSVVGVDFSDTAGFTVPISGGLSGFTNGLDPLNSCMGIIASSANLNNVVTDAKTINTDPNVPSGQIGLDSNAWPIIQLYDFVLDSNVIIQYNKGSNIQSSSIFYTSPILEDVLESIPEEELFEEFGVFFPISENVFAIGSFGDNPVVVTSIPLDDDPDLLSLLDELKNKSSQRKKTTSVDDPKTKRFFGLTASDPTYSVDFVSTEPEDPETTNEIKRREIIDRRTNAIGDSFTTNTSAILYRGESLIFAVDEERKQALAFKFISTTHDAIQSVDETIDEQPENRKWTLEVRVNRIEMAITSPGGFIGHELAHIAQQNNHILDRGEAGDNVGLKVGPPNLGTGTVKVIIVGQV